MHTDKEMEDHSQHSSMMDEGAAKVSHEDHSGHEGHDNHGESIVGHAHPSGRVIMPMFFFVGPKVPIAFGPVHGWQAKDDAGYALGWFATFFLAIFIEGLLALRAFLTQYFQISKLKVANAVVVPNTIETQAEGEQERQIITIKLTWLNRLALMLLFSTISFLAFCLMLVVMTFEVGILLSAAGGLSLGNMVFQLVELPQLPSNVHWTAKRGNYEPNPDPCCGKTPVFEETELTKFTASTAPEAILTTERQE